MVKSECVKFDKLVYKQVNYKIQQSKVPNNAQTYTIHLAFDRGCFEAILIENTFRTLGINTISKGQGFQRSTFLLQGRSLNLTFGFWPLA